MQTELLQKLYLQIKTFNKNGEQFYAFGQKYFAVLVKIKKNIQNIAMVSFAALPYETCSVHKNININATSRSKQFYY